MWVESMEKKLDGAEPMATKEKWRKHCIFRVPQHFKVCRGNVFQPQTVALGPFHHGDPNLHPMEEHKLRAVLRVLRRAGNRPLRELAAVVEEVAEELEDAYAGLDAEWCGEENRGKFLEMMVADGCFLLEMMRGKFMDYDRDDPVFGEHAMRHIEAFVQRDMLMIENQLPLALLQRIIAFEKGQGQLQDEQSINYIVTKFLCCAPNNIGPPLGLHPLDLYHKSLLLQAPPPSRANSPSSDQVRQQGGQSEHYSASFCLPVTRTEPRAVPRSRGAVSMPEDANKDPRSARRLWNAGIRFRCTDRPYLNDIHFNRRSRVLDMPWISLDDSTEYKYSNLMAAFVLFMRDMIESADDVAALRDGEVLDHDLAGSDWAVVRLLNRLTKDVAKFDVDNLWRLRREEVEKYCKEEKRGRVFVFRSWAKLKRSHLSSPWAVIAHVFSLLLVGTDIIQTVFAVKQGRS